MCGICGWLSTEIKELDFIINVNRLASHRGPDGEGYWFYDGTRFESSLSNKSRILNDFHMTGTACLGHRRLAIIDLSEAGLQPMASFDATKWIVFNGEIYNYLELRKELKSIGHNFHTSTDTEVILTAYEEWGTNCFNRFNGMWSVAIIDLSTKRLILSRDRLGVKPLYFLQSGDSIAFASEIKQFFALPNFFPEANIDAVIEYIETGYETPSYTFFRNIMAFPPGCFSVIDINHPHIKETHSYWQIDSSLDTTISIKYAREKLRDLFKDAVKLRLRSDVSVGVCLSGGLDSSAIYGQIQAINNNSDQTHAFTACYHDHQFDESKYVDIVLNKYGGRPFITYPDVAGFISEFDHFIYQHDEPPASMSQYAAWTVMQLASQHNTPVILNGQGGDELFGGYWPAYYLYLRQTIKKQPINVLTDLFGSILPGGNNQLVTQIPPHIEQYLYRRNRSNKNILLPYLQNTKNKYNNWAIQTQTLKPEEYRWGEISNIHLPRLLKWDDRNSMAFGVEGRYPFLDYRLVEFALSIPPYYNFYRGWNKYLMRSSFYDILPSEIQWRRTKIGFVTPQSKWLLSNLKPVIQDWIKNPSFGLRQIIQVDELNKIARKLLSSRSINPMDEDQHLIFRLFALDKWSNVFNVQFS